MDAEQTNPAEESRGEGFTSIKKTDSSETKIVKKFSNLSEGDGTITSVLPTTALVPPLEPRLLLRLVQQNNTLLQCVEAMEVNIDGTGYELKGVGSEEPSEAELEEVQQFFDEPFPSKSLTEIRRMHRRYLESTGNSYIEVVRNLKGELVGLRVLDPQYVRLMPLSPQVTVRKELVRKGSVLEVEYLDRERGFVFQPEVGTATYFIEYGSTQQINRTNGLYSLADLGELKGNEVIHLTMNDDPASPYGVPRWINQLPSVIGSRKAEEQNLEFFDAGGIPSVLVFVKGGAIARGTTTQLNGFLNGKGASNGRGAVIEVASTSGSINDTGSVDIQVERFGAESVKDSLYQGYDKACEEHVRLAFRLPPIFLGKSADYNYATATVAYQVAEAQVFKPDRDDFDLLMNRLIRRELGVTTVVFKSLPITLSSLEMQLKGVETLKHLVEPSELVETVNKLTNVQMQYKEGSALPLPTKTEAAQDLLGTPVTKLARKSDMPNTKALQLLQFAETFAQTTGLVPSDVDYTDQQVEQIRSVAKGLSQEDQEFVAGVVSIYLYDQRGLVDPSSLA